MKKKKSAESFKSGDSESNQAINFGGQSHALKTPQQTQRLSEKASIYKQNTPQF